MTDSGEAVNAKGFFNGSKIKIEQMFEYGEISFGKMIDGPVIGAYLLAGHAEGVFIGQQQEGQIVVPKIVVKPILGGKV